jgi:hypothetical protein
MLKYYNNITKKLTIPSEFIVFKQILWIYFRFFELEIFKICKIFYLYIFLSKKLYILYFYLCFKRIFY